MCFPRKEHPLPLATFLWQVAANANVAVAGSGRKAAFSNGFGTTVAPNGASDRESKKWWPAAWACQRLTPPLSSSMNMTGAAGVGAAAALPLAITIRVDPTDPNCVGSVAGAFGVAGGVSSTGLPMNSNSAVGQSGTVVLCNNP